jgi:putative transposase
MYLNTAQQLSDTAARIVRSSTGGPLRQMRKARWTKPTGTFVSLKAGSRAMPWESMGAELPALELCEFASPVVALLSQPHRLEINVRGSARPLIYFPDLELDIEPDAYHRILAGVPFAKALLEWSPAQRRPDDRPMKLVVEVKSDDDPRDNDPKYQRKLKLAADIYKSIGVGFVTVRLSTDLACVDLPRIHDFLIDRYTEVSVADYHRAAEFIDRAGVIERYDDLVEALGGGPVGKSKAAALHVRRAITLDIGAADEEMAIQTGGHTGSNSMSDPAMDIRPGQLFLFPKKSRESVYELHEIADDGTHVFVAKSGRSTTKLSRKDVTEKFSATGEIIRVYRDVELSPSESFTYVDPRTFMDPEEASGRAERRAIVALKRKHIKALTQQFYVRKFDAGPYPGRSHPKLTTFIRMHEVEARSLGLDPDFSTSTLRRSINDCGKPGARELHHFLDRKDSQKGSRWDPYILMLKAEMIDLFWSKKAPKLWEVQNEFSIRIKQKNEELSRLGVKDLLGEPSDEALRLWINSAEDYYRYKARYGKLRADRRFRGQNRAIQASRPLEYVMFDHTPADAWANVENASGQVLMQERPWLMLAVDVFSRAPLAAILTFEQPSIATVVLCMKQLIRKKDFLPPELRNYKNFDDFWGKPSFIIVDCAWEFAEVSFQTMCESMGISIIWAPIHTPEFKCHVEHAFDLLNKLYWHRLPSGIPHKPHVMNQLRLDPRSKADRNLAQMTDGLWYALRKAAFSKTDSFEMSPALVWKDGVERHGRPMINDVNAFDSFLGRVKSGQLTTSGIKYDNQQFHDPLITGALLNDMMRFAKKSLQRKSAAPSGVARVHFMIDETCEAIRVWNPVTKLNVHMPNVLRRFSAGLRWKEADDCRQLARDRNLLFCSEDEMLEVVAALRATYEPTIASQPFREARKLAGRFTPGTKVVAGSVVEEVFEDPSDSGMGTSVPNSIPAHERTDGREVIKSSRRGGAEATRKAAATRATNRKKAAAEMAQRHPAIPEGAPNEASAVPASVWTQIQDAEGLLADLRSNL